MSKGRSVRGALAVCLAIAVAAPAAAHAEDDHTFVVRGSTSAYSDIRLNESIFLDPTAIKVSSRSSHVAVIIEALDEKPANAFVVFYAPALRDEVQWTGGSGRLLPGRYRVRLVTKAAAQVSIAVDRAGRTVRPTQRLQVTTHTGQATVAPGRTDTSFRLRNAVPAGSQALLAFEVPGRAYEDAYVCPTNDERCPRQVVLLPSPLPNPDPGFRPAQPDRPRLQRFAAYRETRAALFGVNGVRAEQVVVRGFSLAYAP